MKTKKMYYDIFSGPEIMFEARNIKKARQIVRGLANSGNYVICDRIIITNSTCHSRRMFRNDPDFPLNDLRA